MSSLLSCIFIPPYSCIKSFKIFIKQKKRKDAQHHWILEKMQIKTTTRYQHTPVRMAIIKKSTNNKCRRGYGEHGSLLHSWWECMVQPLWKTVWGFLKKLKVTISSSSPTPRHISGENSNLKRYMHPSIHSSTIYNSQEREATQMFNNRWMDKEDMVCLCGCV